MAEEKEKLEEKEGGRKILFLRGCQLFRKAVLKNPSSGRPPSL